MATVATRAMRRAMAASAASIGRVAAVLVTPADAVRIAAATGVRAAAANAARAIITQARVPTTGIRNAAPIAVFPSGSALSGSKRARTQARSSGPSR